MLGTPTDLARSKSELVEENALHRQQLIILRRQVKRPACTKTDRMLLVLLAKMARNWKHALFIVQPETLLRWHRQGFKLYWKYKSRAPSAKLKISGETVALIKEMASNNRLWGAERIRGELLKLDIHVCKRTIQKYMRSVRLASPRGQKWSTFLHTHAEQIWACDFLPVTDLFFHSLFAFFIIELHSRKVIHVRVTRYPTDAWTAQQLREATAFGVGPRYLIRDNDGKFGVWASLGLLRRLTLRFLKLLITPRARMPSVSGSSAVYGVTASIICSSCMRSSSTACSTRICTPSTDPDRIKASSSTFRSRKLGQRHHIMKLVRSSPSQSWAACIVTIAEVPEFFQR